MGMASQPSDQQRLDEGLTLGVTPHEWISKSGRPWSLRVKSDLCAKCGTTPDAHSAPPSQVHEHDLESCDDCRTMWLAGHKSALTLSAAIEAAICYACESARNAPEPQAAEFCLKHAPNIHGADACAWGDKCGCERRAREVLDTRGHPIVPRDGIPPTDDEVIPCPGDDE